jgi:hypothetical protein
LKQANLIISEEVERASALPGRLAMLDFGVISRLFFWTCTMKVAPD